MNFLYRFKQFILISGDFLSYLAGFFIALTVRYWQIPGVDIIQANFNLFLTVFVFWLIINYINGLYDLTKLDFGKSFFRRISETALLALVVGVFFFYIIPDRNISPKTILVLTVFFSYSLMAPLRFILQKIIGAKKLTTNVVFVGYTKEMEELARILFKNPKRGYRIEACIDENEKCEILKKHGVDIYQRLNSLRPAITTHKANLIVIAPHLQKNKMAVRELYELLFWNVEITDLASFYENITGRIPPSTFSESWFLDHIKNSSHPFYTNLRAIIDYLAGIIGAAVFVCLFPIIASLIKLSSKGPIFFKQKRIGHFGNIFTIYKFRSMFALAPDGSAEVAGAEFAKKGDKRVTLIGKILRKTRLDEVPQFINLLKREVTLIGPRPERPEIVKKLEEMMPYYPLRHVVRPGITGWAVLHQNYTDTMETSLQKLQYDLFYIKNRSFVLDLLILLRTINVILRGKGQ